MKYFKVPACLFFLVPLFVCCTAAIIHALDVTPEMVAVPSYILKALTPLEAREMMETKQDLILVDIRSMKELKLGVIKGSLLVSLTDLTKGRHGLPKGKPILLTCTLGGRSAAASRYLIKEGYKEVYYILGGVEAWKEDGFPVQY